MQTAPSALRGPRIFPLTLRETENLTYYFIKLLEPTNLENNFNATFLIKE